jgi:hypothetical protein
MGQGIEIASGTVKDEASGKGNGACAWREGAEEGSAECDGKGRLGMGCRA